MDLSLIQIGQSLAVKANLDVPTTLVGNTERTAQLIFECIKDGTTIDAFHDVDWAVLRLEHKFTTTGIDYDASNTGGYELPADFDRIINGTIWDRTNGVPIIGPVSPEKWQEYRSGLSGLTGSSRICRLGPRTSYIIGVDVNYNRRFMIYPDDPVDTNTEAPVPPPNTAADPIDVVFEYISNRYIINMSGTSGNIGTDWKSDSDYSLMDGNVIKAAALYRLLRTIGMGYADEFEEYKALVHDAASNDAGAETFSMNQVAVTFGVNIPDTGYGS